MEKKTGSVASAISEAQYIIETAKKRADEIIAQAEGSISSAQERGYNDGINIARKELGDKSIKALMDQGKLEQRIMQEAGKLALEISRIVIGEHIKTNPEVIKKIALSALASSLVGENVSIIAHPEDIIVLRKEEQKLKQVSECRSIRFEENSDFSRGGCLVRTDFGEIDCTIEALLKSLANQIGIIDS